MCKTYVTEDGAGVSELPEPRVLGGRQRVVVGLGLRLLVLLLVPDLDTQT